jgi:CDP-ribitol ribitolphosphotransferase
MSRLEYLLAATALRLLGAAFSLLPGRPRRIVLATARVPVLDGNLLHIERAIRRLRPSAEIVVLAEPYGYGFRGKVAYALRVVRGMYHLRTAGLVVLDNAYLPVHVAPHPRRTTVVQVWHAVGALKRFGRDTTAPLQEPERTFLHRHYDVVVTSGAAAREPWSRAFGTPVERVLPLGAARTDFFFDASALAAARERVLARHPALRGRRVILHAPTFRGRGRGKHPGSGFDAPSLRAALPESDALVLKSHPNLDARLVPQAGYDVVADPAAEMNDLLAAADVLITDYSSSIFEWALLRRPLLLHLPDLATYERDPGLYLDLEADRPGTIAIAMDEVIAALTGTGPAVPDEAFIRRHLDACDGHASERFVERFLPTAAA